MARRHLIFIVLALLAAPVPRARAQPADQAALGLWLVEEKTGIVEIYHCGAALCGRIAWMREPLRPDGSIKRDDKNPDPAKRSRTICGMDTLTGFMPAGPNEWEDGRAYDPNEGSTYHAEMRIEPDGRLRLRGYIGIPLFGQSRLWTRAPADTPRCSAS
jgi:uncharacterized protein (DUF2147 family)